MKFLPLLVASIGFGAAAWPGRQQTQIVIITGDADGNLAPCGCTKPQTGGIKRRIAAVKQFSLPGHTTLLDNGNFVAGTGRQDQIKAQTMAEILGAAGWDAINVGPADARLGMGLLLSMNGLANGKFVASQLQPSPDSGLQQFSVSPPFLVIGVAAQPETVGQPLGQVASPMDDAVKAGIEQAKADNLAPVALLQGTREDSLQLASRFPDLKLISYRSVGSPPEKMEFAGATALVSPGSDGKYLLRMEYRGGKFSNYAAIAFGPQYKDDPTAARQFRNYLTRVRTEKLVEKLPRLSNDAYMGSLACGKCHSTATHVWKASLHTHALATLAARGEDRDPECLPCHVVGLSSSRGFRSPAETPDLAGVGCESCHGPGSAHSASPRNVRIPKVTETACLNCHTSNTSPGFSFPAYWKKIKH
jgi:hypothetical protein